MLAETSTRFLTFRVGAQLYALPAEEVSEVIRMPTLAHIPQAPQALLGVANLRGTVLPVAGLHELLQQPAAAITASSRAIVLDIGAAAAIVVDAVETLESISSAQVEIRHNEVSATSGEKLLGTFSITRNQTVAKILDIKALLEAAFSKRAATEPRLSKISSAAGMAITNSQASTGNANTELLVTFEIAGQEFALPLNVVEEILPVPASVTQVARAEAVVLGVTSVRNTLLPLLSLRGLLGFEATAKVDEREKIVVMKVAGTQVGLIADRARSVLAADVELMDPVPPVLAARTGGESRIRSIYRGNAGRRLISILSPEQLFREDVMQRLVAGQHGQDLLPSSTSSATHESATQSELIFLVFRLGDDEFGLPINTVVEVAQVPTQITRVPKTPKFLEGVVNLRGDVLPVIDQRRRFDMPTLDNSAGRRLIVIKTERHQAGLIVDSVSDILRTQPDNVEPAPELSDDKTRRLISGVVNLDKSNRIVLLLDPTEVLTRAEQSLLDTFQAARQKAKA